MRSDLRILIAEPDDFSEEAIRKLQNLGQVECREYEAEDIGSVFQEYDGVWVRLKYKITESMLNRADNRCSFLITATTGLDHLPLKYCNQNDIDIFALKGHTEFLKTIKPTAEHTMALLLSLLRRVPESLASVKSGIWNRNLFRGRELNGMCLGIVGYGRLGSMVAHFARAFGMEIVAYDPYVEIVDDYVEQLPEINELYRRADVVSIHVPLEDSTVNMVNSESFAHMKDGVFVVNTARGGIVDEEAFLENLKSGKIAGAAVDVLQGEPDIDQSHPLVEYSLSNDNLVITPHTGGGTLQSMNRCEEYLADYVVKSLLRK